MSYLLFYKKPVPLHTLVHKDAKVLPPTNYSFARETNSVAITGVEFSHVSKEYPIVFAKGKDNSLIPAGLLGLRDGENVFVNELGRWLGDYVPAFVRRYPFILAEAGDEKELKICVDEGYEGFDTDKGERLFTQSKEYTPFFKQTVDFLKQYHQHYQRTQQLVEKLHSLGLLKDMHAKLTPNEGGNPVVLSGFMVVDEEKLLQLSDQDALALFRSGELAWVYSHLLSLANLQKLANRMSSATVATQQSQSEPALN